MDSNLGRIQSVPTLISIIIELQNMVSVLLESESNDTSIPISKFCFFVLDSIKYSFLENK